VAERVKSEAGCCYAPASIFLHFVSPVGVYFGVDLLATTSQKMGRDLLFSNMRSLSIVLLFLMSLFAEGVDAIREDCPKTIMFIPLDERLCECPYYMSNKYNYLKFIEIVKQK
jgi:hypothetical protein